MSELRATRPTALIFHACLNAAALVVTRLGGITLSLWNASFRIQRVKSVYGARLRSVRSAVAQSGPPAL